MSKSSSLFPDIPTKEQVARYAEVARILDGYRRGLVPFEKVDALSNEEVMEVRNWINRDSVAKLKAAIPEFCEGVDPDVQ